MLISYIHVKTITRLSRHPFINRFFSLDFSDDSNQSNYKSLSENQNYWKKTEYTNKNHTLNILFLGFKIIQFKFFVKTTDKYFKRDTKYLIEPLKEMISKKIIDPINSESKILEVGCNAGRIIKDLNEIYDCQCLGIDISEEAISKGKNILEGNKKIDLKVIDVLNYSWFNNFEKEHFTHIISSSHLVHVPNCKEKTKYINELKRIGINLIFFEKCFSPDEPPSKSLFFEDYEKDYHMHTYKIINKIVYEAPKNQSFITRKLNKKSGIFFKKNK